MNYYLQTSVVVESLGTGKTYTIPYLNRFETSKSYDELEQVGTLVMPQKLFNQFGELTRLVFSMGSRVKVYAGLAPKMHLFFDGFVKYPPRVEFETTVTLENACYVARQMCLDDKIFYGQKLKTIVDYVYKNNNCTGLKNNINPAMGDFKIENNPNVIDVMNGIKRVYGISSWFDGDLLNVGLPSINDTSHTFEVGVNVPTEWSGIKYIDDADVPIVIKGIVDSDQDDKADETLYLSRNGRLKTPEFTSVKPAGKIHRISLSGCSVDDLKLFMRATYDNMAFTGLSGSFTGVSTKVIELGDKITFIDKDNGEPGYNSYAHAIKYTIGVNDGIKQTIEMKYKL